MKKYLIVKCEELGDQWECDANRTPMYLTENWKLNPPTYCFEVWEETEEGFKCIRNYEESLEEGMALYYWNEDQNCEECEPTVIFKYPNRTRNDKVPTKVKNSKKEWEDLTDDLRNCGYITGYCNGKRWVYGEYRDAYFSLGY